MSQTHGMLFAVQLRKSEIRQTKFEGRDYIVVPVIMARSDVVMNGAVFPEDEYFPESWNGVPVTVGHPETKSGSFLSANSPQALTDWSIGRIFNAEVVSGTLRGEAWIDVKRANSVRPGLVKDLMDGLKLDVSTGYFSTAEPAEGVLNGREYTQIHRQVHPDHLAFLPDEQGACNWTDGCGVRANKDKGMNIQKIFEPVVNQLGAATAALKLGLEKISAPMPHMQRVELCTCADKKCAECDGDPEKCNCAKTNARGRADDPKQMVADLISSDKSPFLPDDMYALQSLHPDTLKHFAAQYCPSGKSNSSTTGETELKPEEIQALIDNAVTKAVSALSVNAKAELSAEDRTAIDAARKIVAEQRDALEASVVANTNLKKEQLAAFTNAQLETLVSGIKPAAPVGDYSARAFARDDNDDPGEDMGIADFATHFNKKKDAA